MAAPLPQLINPEGYSPDTFAYISRDDLKSAGTAEFPALEDWLAIFYNSIESFTKIAEADPAVPPEERKPRALAFGAGYKAALDRLVDALHGQSAEQKLQLVNCLELCRLREQALLDAGFIDPFLPIKHTENEKALALLPEVCAEIDAETDMEKRWELVIRGVCAANIFDLGAAHTSDMYHENGCVSFHDTREQLLSRPWVVDDLDSILSRFVHGPSYAKAVLFVDNSGADVMLGMLPLARELLRRGTTVIIAANELPSINDITYSELDALLPAVAAVDPILCKGISTRKMRIVSSGSGLPVIDLSRLSAELVEEAEGAELIVLEGMGRSIETNLNAKLSCDALKIGMVKHPEVAAALGGRMLDCVVKFDGAAEPAV